MPGIQYRPVLVSNALPSESGWNLYDSDEWVVVAILFSPMNIPKLRKTRRVRTMLDTRKNKFISRFLASRDRWVRAR